MKKSIVSLGLIILHFAACGQVSLNTGESYVFNFALPYTGVAQADVPTVTVFFSGGAAGKNWSAKMDFFPDTIADVAFYSDTYTHIGPVPPFEQVGRGYSFDSGSPPPWPDAQGIVRVTAMNGPFQLDQIFVQEDVGGGYYSAWIPATVPEPSPGALLMMGFFAVFAVRMGYPSQPTREATAKSSRLKHIVS